MFAEWFGAKSFAGQHEEDDPKDIVIFDVNPHKKGFLSPKQFLDYFGHLKVAEFVYRGNLNEMLIKSVKNSDFDYIDFRSSCPIKTVVPEGVVCKSGKGHGLWMCKIKSQNWFDELYRRRPQGWEKLIEDDLMNQ